MHFVEGILIALEALSPQQRAVLLLRDVFDYSVRETADALSLSEANVSPSWGNLVARNRNRLYRVRDGATRNRDPAA